VRDIKLSRDEKKDLLLTPNFKKLFLERSGGYTIFEAKSFNYDYKHFKEFRMKPFYFKYMVLKNRIMLRLFLYAIKLRKNYYRFKLKINNFKKYNFSKLYRRKR